MRLAHYVDKQVDIIMKMPKEKLQSGLVDWLPPPDWKNVLDDTGVPLPALTDAQIAEEKERQLREIQESGGVYVDEESLPEGWKAAFTDAGKLYYWNTDTRESSWERPKKEKEQAGE
jgi:hypothetical protein